MNGPSIVPTADHQPQKGTAEDFLLNAPIYQAGSLGELNCPAEKLGDGSLAAQKVYYEKLFKCLNDAWRPAFAKIGQKPPDPGLVVFDKTVTSPCGRFEPLSGRVLAFYCYGNQVMYTDVKQMNKAFGPKQDLAFLMTIAHEYGHHVQGVSDLFYARAVYLQDHPEQKLESSRRNELQASCFAGVFSRLDREVVPVHQPAERVRVPGQQQLRRDPRHPRRRTNPRPGHQPGLLDRQRLQHRRNQGLQHLRRHQEPGEVAPRTPTRPRLLEPRTATTD